MSKEDIVAFLENQTTKLNGMRELSYKETAFKTWESTVDGGLASIYGEDSRQHKEWTSIHYISLVIGRNDPQRDKEAFQRGLNQAEAYLKAWAENIKLFGLPQHINSNSSDNGRTQESHTTVQNFYLSQQQIQSVNHEVDLSGLDQVTKDRVDELLQELAKKSGQNKAKIQDLVKWIADRSIDVLIALITAQK